MPGILEHAPPLADENALARLSEFDEEQRAEMRRTNLEQGWAVDFKGEDDTPRTPREKAIAYSTLFGRFVVLLGSLYLFICSLGFLSDGFRLVAGRRAGEIFQNSVLFENQIVCMLVGMLVTVLVQSSSTSTSIFIAMVAAGLLTVQQGIPIIMGSNIGTSVTSTIVAMGQAGERDEFRRAFAAATVHDMFNFLSVLVFLPLEMATSFLYHASAEMVGRNDLSNRTGGDDANPPDFLGKLTDPFTDKVLQLNSRVIQAIATADPQELAEIEGQTLLVRILWYTPSANLTAGESYAHSDEAVGAGVVIVALLLLTTMLYLIVSQLKAVLKGRVAVWLHASVNGYVPDLRLSERCVLPMAWITGYLAIVAGAGITILVQSSSITTSALTPLVGIGVIEVERMYATVLGANLGTCVTGILAAFAADATRLRDTLQVAYCHLLFNVAGIFLWYTIWPLRPIPVNAAKYLGNTTAEYKWFALAYLAFAFFLVPLVFMGFSLWGDLPLHIALSLILLGAAVLLLIAVLQKRKPRALPPRLRTWDFLPPALRSLEPWDRLACQPAGACWARYCGGGGQGDAGDGVRLSHPVIDLASEKASDAKEYARGQPGCAQHAGYIHNGDL